jgi:hypothetical protein
LWWLLTCDVLASPVLLPVVALLDLPPASVPPSFCFRAPGYKDVHLLSGQRVTRAIDTPLYRIEVSETLSQSQGRHVQ